MNNMSVMQMVVIAFDLTLFFVIGMIVGHSIGNEKSYKKGREDGEKAKREEIRVGMDELLEKGDFIIYTRKGTEKKDVKV